MGGAAHISPSRSFAPPSRSLFQGSSAHHPAFPPRQPGRWPYPGRPYNWNGVGYRGPYFYAGYPGLLSYGYGLPYGGGFGDDGVHNVLEAAVYGKPVVFGPVIEKYIEAVELTESGGGLIIDSAVEAEKVFNRLLQDPQECRETGEASRNYVHSKKGATERIIRYITMQKMLEK